jgi:hypothetical protein
MRAVRFFLLGWAGVSALLGLQVSIPKLAPLEHDVRPSPGVKVKFLSDYLPSLLGTPGDSPVYVLEGAEPGGTAFVAGGTHGGEVGGIMAAILLVERVRVECGRLVVLPHANNSAASYRDESRAAGPPSFSVATASGERRFVIGSRLTHPGHQGEPDPPGGPEPSLEVPFDVPARNLDRRFPGKADGNLTDRIAAAVVALLLRERVDLAFDLHEAPPGSRLAMMVVANPKNVDLAAEAVLNLEAADLRLKLEESSATFRGLSHREWGDATPARAFLFETPNPGMGRDAPGDPVADPDWPLAKRAGIHLAALGAIVDAWNGGVESERKIVFSGLPGWAELAKAGLGSYLR